MINNFFIIKELLLSKLKNQPYKLGFAVTYKCNSKCIHCNVWKIYKDNSLKSNKELRLDEIENIFKNLPKNLFWLAITGGEPFLRDDLTEIIRLAKRNMPSLRLVSIASNALAKEKITSTIKKLNKINGIIFYITLSIDGPEKINDKIRGVKGSYNRIIETYNSLKKITSSNKNFNILLETTISKKNINYLYDFFYENINNNKKEFIVSLYHNAYLYKNGYIKDNYLNINFLDLKKILKLVKRNLSYISPIQLIQIRYLTNILKYLKNPKNQVLPCFALKDSFAINPYGEILPCLMWGKSLGNIRNYNYNIKKIWNSNKFNNVRSKIRNNSCPNCWTPCQAYQTLISNLISFKR